MSIESGLFKAGVVAFVLIGIVYGVLTDWSEPVGWVALVLTGLMCGMIGVYLSLTARKLDARPEDNPLAFQEEAEGDYGFFSPHSWWPLPLAASAALAFLGLAVGWWVFIVGVVFGILSLVGWTFEYFRGENAR